MKSSGFKPYCSTQINLQKLRSVTVYHKTLQFFHQIITKVQPVLQ
uniref:Uncharacterized protein n=1 Tax=Rhizophora mucronata TaxID=61149 RepID=A0A2P2NLM2_RHIMU